MGESTVRKLLVASQKSGVGKSTTSMNLAAATASTGTRVLLFDADPLSTIGEALKLSEHPRRQLLRALGVDLPGALVVDFLPGLDVLCPYAGEHCSDADFERLLRVLATPTAQQFHGCLIVDVPPFMGGNAAQLLALCDEFLLVMRAEAMAYRTLPALLELVQRSSRDGLAPPMRGILLTLPDGEQPGGRWERELRGRFGARALAEAIPYDERIGEALKTGQIGSHRFAESPAGQQYNRLVGTLNLTSETSAAFTAEQFLGGLREAAETVGPIAVGPSLSSVESIRESEKTSVEVALFVPPPEPVPVAPAPSHRVRRVSRSGEIPRPKRIERNLPPAAPPAPVPSTEPVQPHANALAQLWPLWILLGAVLGGGIRFLPPTASMLPILVGVGVTLLVVVGLIAVASQDRRAPGTEEGERKKPRSREIKKVKPKGSPRADAASARLAALADSSKLRRRDSGIN